jgi:hypothetical protein
MSQIDFGRALANPAEPVTPSPGDERTRHSSEAANGIASLARIGLARVRRIRFGLPEWTNIFFTLITIGGGLFYAFYSFNGTQLFRTVGRWPREYLYPRPGSTEDLTNERSRLAESLGLPALPEVNRDAKNSGDPFSRISGLLRLQPSNGPNASDGGRISSGPTSGVSTPNRLLGPAGFPAPGSPVSGLGLSAPGGDRLTQSLNRAADDVTKAAKLEARRTIIVVKNAITEKEKKEGGKMKRGSKSGIKTAHAAGGQTRVRHARLTQSGTAKHSALSATGRDGASAASTFSAATNGVGSMKSIGNNGAGGLRSAQRQITGAVGAAGGHAGGIGAHGRGR